MLKEGTRAPAFSLPDQDGNPVSLEDYRGRKVVLYFYSKDHTSGCTKQACGFAERYPLFLEKGAAVLGVSRDTVASHKKFEEKHGLPFPLLSDPDQAVRTAYDAVGVRTTYLIDGEGIIVKAMTKVNAATNAQDVLALL